MPRRRCASPPGRRRPPSAKVAGRPSLAKRQVAAQDVYALRAERLRGCGQERRAAITAGAVGYDQAPLAGALRPMQKAANAGTFEWNNLHHAGQLIASGIHRSIAICPPSATRSDRTRLLLRCVERAA